MQHFIGINVWARDNAGSGTDAQRTAEDAVAVLEFSELEYGTKKPLTAAQRAALIAGQRVAFYERGHAAPYRYLEVVPCQCGWPQRH